MKKRIFAFLLAVCMVFGMTSVALADETTPVDVYFSPMAQPQNIVAGAEVTFNGYRIGGTILTIENENAYVIFEGQRYDAVEGVVTVEFPASNPFMPTEFVVGNMSRMDATFDFVFTLPVGSVNNPEVLSSEELGGYGEAVIKEGNAEGYFYTYMVEEDGIFTLSASAFDANYDRIGCSFVINNVTQGTYGTSHYTLTQAVEYVKVSAGDELQIVVNTYDETSYENPAGTVSVSAGVVTKVEDMEDATIMHAPGAEMNPLAVQGNFFAQTILAGDSYYYSVRGVAGNTLTIANADIKVIYRGVTYTANEEGVIEIVMLDPVDSWTPDTFQIVNESENNAEIEAEFVIPAGTRENPEVLESEQLGGEVSLKEGDFEGYFYTYTAPADGKLIFEIYSATGENVAANIVVNNLMTYAQKNLIDDSITDEYGTRFELEVSEGDILSINVVVNPDEETWAIPAADISWGAYLELPVGTESNPIQLEDITAEHKVPMGSTYFMTMNLGSVLNITADGNFKVVFNGEVFDSENKALSIEIPAAAGIGRPMPASLEVINDADDPISVKFEFVYPAGDAMNPDEIEVGTHEAVREEGAGSYYYEFVAPIDGKVTITVTGTNGWQYSVMIPEKGVYGDTHWSDDEELVPSETIDVTAGDVVQIIVSTYDPDNMWATPAGTVTTTVTIEKEYTITDGADQKFTADEDGNITIKCEGDIAEFLGIKVDGVEVAKENYTVVAGSTIVTLKADYLKTLESGDHIVTFVYEYGTVDATITTVAEDAPEKPIVSTGDDANIGLWIAVLGLGVVAVAGSIVLKRKSK